MSKHATATPALTQERLRELLHYDPETGMFTWRVNRGRTAKAGQAAGRINPISGYVDIMICGKNYKGHRLAWLYMTGEFPSCEVDHIGRNKSDNRWKNLREASRSQNCWNTRLSKKNKSGYKGVSWDKEARKWAASIRIDGKQKRLGRFSSLSDAAAAYAAAAQKHYGEFAHFPTSQ